MLKKKIALMFSCCFSFCGFLQGAGDSEELASNLAGMVRAYKQAISLNKQFVDHPFEYFQEKGDALKALEPVRKHARIYYKLYAGREYPDDYSGKLGAVYKHFEESIEDVGRKVLTGEYSFKWEGGNAYVKKWDGKLLPARYLTLALIEFDRISEGQVEVKLTTSSVCEI